LGCERLNIQNGEGLTLLCGLCADAMPPAISINNGSMRNLRQLHACCRWQAAREDFLRALDIESAAGSPTSAALLNNLGKCFLQSA